MKKVEIRSISPEQFCYWLQGMLECKPEGDLLSLRETKAIRDHIALVFTKVTPENPPTDPPLIKSHQRKTRDIVLKRYC